LKNIILKPAYIIQEGVTDLELYEGRKYTLRASVLLHNKKLYLYKNLVRFIHYDLYNPSSIDTKVHVNHLSRLPLLSDTRILT